MFMSFELDADGNEICVIHGENGQPNKRYYTGRVVDPVEAAKAPPPRVSGFVHNWPKDDKRP